IPSLSGYDVEKRPGARLRFWCGTLGTIRTKVSSFCTNGVGRRSAPRAAGLREALIADRPQASEFAENTTKDGEVPILVIRQDLRNHEQRGTRCSSGISASMG